MRGEPGFLPSFLAVLVERRQTEEGCAEASAMLSGRLKRTKDWRWRYLI